MNLYRPIALFLVVLCAGCAANPMVESSSQAIPRADSTKAQIVFFRSAYTGGSIKASVCDVTDENVVFIGIVANKTKIVYEVAPGKHRFMVVSEAADFMDAEVLPGKTYYALITPRWGAWKARFSLWPVRNDGTTKYNTDSEEFAKRMSDTTLMMNSDLSRQWYEQNKASVQEKYARYLVVWNEKTPEALAERTLDPDDGT